MLRHIKRDIVSAVIISKDNKILFGKQDQARQGVYPDCWHIPGGGVEESETKTQALVREVLEETGIDVTDYTFELIDNTRTGISEKTLKTNGEKVICHMNFNDYKILLETKSSDVKLNPTDDLVELKWVDISDLSIIKLTPPSIELFVHMGLLKT